MSEVTNVILTGVTLERFVEQLDDWFIARNLPVLEAVTDYGGGNKYMECEIFIGAYNHFERESFYEHVASLDWQFRNSVQLFMTDRDTAKFKMYNLSDTEKAQNHD